MRLVRQIKKEHLFILLFGVIFLVTRLPGIRNDILNPDAANWHLRAEQFVVGLKHFQLEKTYQHYQPGVTLMWIVGPTVEVIKQINGDLVYNKDTFLIFHQAAKTALIFTQLCLSIVGIFLLSKLIDFKKALLVFSLFSFEPFFLANSRLLHMDVLLTLLLFNGLISSYLYLKQPKRGWGVLAGVFLGFATLTKSVAVGGILFAAGVGGLYLYKQKGKKEALRYAGVILGVSLLTFVVFFPALWVNTKEVLWNMYDGITRVGIRRGHNQVFFGEATRDAGILFYPVVFLLKTSPFFLLLTVLSAFKLKKPKKELTLTVFLAIFFVGYLVVMTISSKKIDRYFLPVYPFLSLLVVLCLEKSKKLIRGKWGVLGALLFTTFVVWPYFKLYPYPFTYTNPLLGSPAFVHENILAQKPFGVGIPALKETILERYGDYPRLGFIDKKPMAAIYRGSRVFNIRVDGTRRYDLLIMGVNEEVPEKVLSSGFNFVHDYSMYINGLEYWRIYVKEI